MCMKYTYLLFILFIIQLLVVIVVLVVEILLLSLSNCQRLINTKWISDEVREWKRAKKERQLREREEERVYFNHGFKHINSMNIYTLQKGVERSLARVARKGKKKKTSNERMREEMGRREDEENPWQWEGIRNKIIESQNMKLVFCWK